MLLVFTAVVLDLTIPYIERQDRTCFSWTMISIEQVVCSYSSGMGIFAKVREGFDTVVII